MLWPYNITERILIFKEHDVEEKEKSKNGSRLFCEDPYDHRDEVEVEFTPFGKIRIKDKP